MWVDVALLHSSMNVLSIIILVLLLLTLNIFDRWIFYFEHFFCMLSHHNKLATLGHRTYIELAQDVHETSSELLMYVQFTSSDQWRQKKQ